MWTRLRRKLRRRLLFQGTKEEGGSKTRTYKKRNYILRSTSECGENDPPGAPTAGVRRPNRDHNHRPPTHVCLVLASLAAICLRDGHRCDHGIDRGGAQSRRPGLWV